MEIRKIQEVLEEFIFVSQGIRLGIFNELSSKPDSSDGLAERMNFNTRCLAVVLGAFVEMKYLEKNEQVYSVTLETSKRLVNEGSKDYEADFWKFLYYLIDPWRSLKHVLTTGLPDESTYKELSIPDFIRAMDTPWKKVLAPEIVDLCLENCPHAGIVMDIGGAPGTIAREFASRGIKTIVFDLPECTAVTVDKLSHVENISVIQGDATVSLPEEKCDIAFLGNLCHGQSPDDNKKIFARCFEQLRDNGILVIFENIRDESPLGARLALHMITQSRGGNIYSRKDYLKWIEETGFRDARIEDLSDNTWQIIIAKK